MESFSWLHWLIVWFVFSKIVVNIVSELLFVASPVLGIIRGVKNSSILHPLLSIVIPMYGIVYFSVGRKRA